MSMKNSCDTIGNRTRDLTAYGTVPQPTVPAGCVFIRLGKQSDYFRAQYKLIFTAR